MTTPAGTINVSTLDRLQALLQKDFELSPEALQPAARLEELQIDSLRMLEVLFAVEDAFKITVGSNQAELKARLQTVADLVAYIDELGREQRPAASEDAAAGEAAP
jgi:acyl carrier protein